MSFKQTASANVKWAEKWLGCRFFYSMLTSFYLNMYSRAERNKRKLWLAFLPENIIFLFFLLTLFALLVMRYLISHFCILHQLWSYSLRILNNIYIIYYFTILHVFPNHSFLCFANFLKKIHTILLFCNGIYIFVQILLQTIDKRQKIIYFKEKLYSIHITKLIVFTSRF